MKHEVTISSNGAMGNQAMVILEDGTVLKNVIGVTIFIAPGELVRADLEMVMPEVVVKAVTTSVAFLCPVCSGELSHSCQGDTFAGP